METQEEIRDVCAVYVFEASSQSIVIIHAGRAVSAAPLSCYRQQVQMVKGRCSAKKKKEKKKKEKKNKHLVPLL